LVYVSFVKSISSLVVTGAHETERTPLLSTEYDDDARFPVQPASAINTTRIPVAMIPVRMVQHPRQ
jgi:hypothetical protein